MKNSTLSKKLPIPGQGLLVMTKTFAIWVMGEQNLDSWLLPNFCSPQAEVCWRWTMEFFF